MTIVLAIHPFEDWSQQVGDKESIAPDQCRTPKDDAAEPADFSAGGWIVCVTVLADPQARRNDSSWSVLSMGAGVCGVFEIAEVDGETNVFATVD